MSVAGKDRDEMSENEQFCGNHYALMKYKGELNVVKSNLPPPQELQLQTDFLHRLEKGVIHSEVGTIVSIEFSSSADEKNQVVSCYYHTVAVDAGNDDTKIEYILCFLLDEELTLELFRADLEKYAAEVLKPIKEKVVTVVSSKDLPESFKQSLDEWYNVAIGYMIRSKQMLGDHLKSIIYSSLHDYKLSISGGTTQQRTDITRFYDACSLRSILSQLRDACLKQDAGSVTGRVDVLADVDDQHSGSQKSVNVIITSDDVEVDSNDCNKFCEEWAKTLNRPEFDNNNTKLRQVTEAFKLKFVQTMNTLKRLLKEAVNDYYALCRSYVFLHNSGNQEILLYFVTTEGALDTAGVLRVLKEYIQEKV